MGTRSTDRQTLTARHGGTRRQRLRGRRISTRETLVAPLMRLWWLLLLVAAGAGVAGYVVSGIRPPVYTASTSIIFADAGAGLRADDVERTLTSRAHIAVSLPNLERVADRVPGTTTASLAEDVEVSADPEAFALEVVVRTGDPTLAAQISDAVVASFAIGEKQAAEAAAKDTREAYGERLKDLDGQVDRARSQLKPGDDDTAAASEFEQLRAERLRLASEATEAVAKAQASALDLVDTGSTPQPAAPSSPRPLQDGALVAVVALLLTAGVVLERNRRAWGDVVDSVELSQAMGVPLLGEISTNPNSSSGAAALGLAVSRLRIAAGKDGGVFLLATVVDGADGARAAHLLAEAAARTRWWPVALMHRALTFGGGWAGAGAGVEGQPVQLYTGDVVPVPYGSVESAEKTILDLRSRGALVVVEGPPARRGGDSSRLSLAADGVIVVVADDQPVEAALDVIEILSMLPTPVLGYIWVTTSGALTQSLPVIAPDAPPAPKPRSGGPASVDVTGFDTEQALLGGPAVGALAPGKSAPKAPARSASGDTRRDEQGVPWAGVTPPPLGSPSVTLGTAAPASGAASSPSVPSATAPPPAHPAGRAGAGSWSPEAAPQEPAGPAWRFGIKAVPTPPFLVRPPRSREAEQAGQSGRPGAAPPGAAHPGTASGAAGGEQRGRGE